MLLVLLFGWFGLGVCLFADWFRWLCMVMFCVCLVILVWCLWVTDLVWMERACFCCVIVLFVI